MELSLINKYKPNNIKEFNINNDLHEIIKTYIKINSINILFIGNPGCGKTTLINIIINEYFKDYKKSVIENNILYINSLKDQGISYYRNDVKTFCQTKSSIKNKKKILVLDDIDIINEQSQQVFRNCIDKYQNNVHFIASCCNPQKIIDTLQSRMNILKLKSFNNDYLSKILDNICLNERISLNNNIKNYLILSCNNSIQILVNNLEKFKLLDIDIDINIANNICSNILYTKLYEYTILCINKKLNEAIKVILDIANEGYSVMDILDNYFLFIKITDQINETQKFFIIKLICKYINIFNSIHEEEIELVFFTNNLIKNIN